MRIYSLLLSIIFVAVPGLITGVLAADTPPVREISADWQQVKGPRSEVYQQCIGAGRAAEGLRAEWQRQLKLCKDEIGFKQIRFHGLLSDDMGVYALRDAMASRASIGSMWISFTITSSPSAFGPLWNLVSCPPHWPAATKPSSGGKAT